MRIARGTEVAPIVCTLCATAQKSRLDPRAYLRLAALRPLRGELVALPYEVTPELAASYGP